MFHNLPPPDLHRVCRKFLLPTLVEAYRAAPSQSELAIHATEDSEYPVPWAIFLSESTDLKRRGPFALVFSTAVGG